MNTNKKNSDRRKKDRKVLTTPLKARFQLEIESEITDISQNGMALKFNTVKNSNLTVHNNMKLHLEMNGKLVSMEADLVQISEKDGNITLGVKYDRSQLAVFSLQK